MSDLPPSHDYKVEPITCPVCQSATATVITHILDIPYYDDYASISISCRDCGYRMNDFMNLQSKPPTRMIYPIESEKDGRTKVVRSREGIVIIPELAIRIEPTGDGTTWIRNIEGILEDIQQKLSISLAYSETEEERNTVKARIELVEQLKEYSQPFTIEVEDPSGNSIILPVDETKLQIIELPVDE